MLRLVQVALFLFPALGLLADSGVGTADLLLLCTPAFPAQLAEGPAWLSLLEGPESVFGNPSLVGSGIAAAGGTWMLGTRSASAAAGFSLLPGTVQAIGVRYLGRGGLQGMDEQGNPTGDFSYSTGALALAFSSRVIPGVGAGVAGCLVWENVASDGGSGLALAAGVSASPTGSLSLGAALTGLGQAPDWNGIHKDMPVALSAGASLAASPWLDLRGAATLGFSTADSYGASANFSMRGLSLLAGYTLAPGNPEAGGARAGLSYDFRSGSGTYSVRLAAHQKTELDWPVLAGLSVSF